MKAVMSKVPPDILAWRKHTGADRWDEMWDGPGPGTGISGIAGPGDHTWRLVDGRQNGIVAQVKTVIGRIIGRDDENSERIESHTGRHSDVPDGTPSTFSDIPIPTGSGFQRS